MSEVFVDTDGLNQAGAQVGNLSSRFNAVAVELHQATDEFTDAAGNDDNGQQLKQTLLPVMQSMTAYVAGLVTAVAQAGQGIQNMSANYAEAAAANDQTALETQKAVVADGSE